ncbi:asparagine synthase (glutamine-hydrolyzing) [Aequorivita marina]|uniref:asparagine synthase (glutamine-hydrolyzing) n=1 Tax=Aequorivita marina TaxID=3073654 RepID=UPI002876D054|nr:asparagine synthase (glutamine-hydrolyzing) [Aequorivita sp. S2608]MDS1298051.1 asparagine synthase (glutamine-hydrolyzing) [Aequorivita sp. S2608]
MCGFLGEFSYNNNLSKTESFTELLSLSKHRGPDSTNIVSGKNYRLGFNRLALLDLTPAGQQPRKSPTQRFHMVFNGEVYNYKALIMEYELKNLKSTSDTEVVLHLLDEIGVVKTLSVLNGMFAIAIIDTTKNELFLTRDFAGIKPLFYGVNDSGVVFASQFDQVFKHAWFQNELKLQPEVVQEYFAFGYMAAPNSIYENIFQIKPGELVKICGKGKTIKKNIVQFSKETSLDSNYDIENLKLTLKKSVKLQLNTERSLASFLSGGVDSSLVSSYAKEQKDDIKAFTLKVNDKKHNESEYAVSYAKHLNINHEIVTVDKKVLLSIIEEHFKAFNEPFGDYSSIPTYLVTKKAAQNHTAMLSGDGGDELFWGYPRMYDLLRKSEWFKVQPFVRKNLVRITNRLKITNTYAPFAKDLETFWRDWHIRLPRQLLSSAFDVGFSKEINALYRIDKNYNKKQLQHFLRWNEFYGHLQRILIKVDRTSMKNSLEVRVPLLDKNVIEESWKVFFSIGALENLKKPLKELLQEKIPDTLLMEGKKGFSVPIELWFRNQLRSDLVDTVLNSDLYGKEYFDQDVLKKYVSEFLEGKHNNGWGVWHIYAWQKWADKFVLE